MPVFDYHNGHDIENMLLFVICCNPEIDSKKCKRKYCLGGVLIFAIQFVHGEKCATAEDTPL